MSEILVTCLSVGPMQANCYVLGCAQTKGAIIIDPGGDPDKIRTCVEKEGLTPTHLINTHGHIDHIGANKEIKEIYPEITICIHKDDAAMLGKPLKNLSLVMLEQYKSPEAEVLLDDGSIVKCGSIGLTVLHTPGHTPGGISLVLDGEPPQIFVGDTLFAGGVGRTDFPGGNWELLLTSIRERIFEYPDEAIVFPGHGPETTVGEERSSNPFLT